MSDSPIDVNGTDVIETTYERLAARLYRAHRAALVSYAGKVSGDRAIAEDVVHDASLHLDRQTGKTVIREPLAYFRRIIRNLVFARARRPARETALPAEVIHDVVDDGPSVETALIARQSMELVLDALEKMPARQKAAVTMYHFDGLKLREVAEQLGLSISHTHGLIVDGELKEIPQSVSVVTAQRIRDQAITTSEDALKQATGVTVNEGSGYPLQTFSGAASTWGFKSMAARPASTISGTTRASPTSPRSITSKWCVALMACSRVRARPQAR
jgi:RNA polymerase sigma factor (sigma-70 family)